MKSSILSFILLFMLCVCWSCTDGQYTNINGYDDTIDDALQISVINGTWYDITHGVNLYIEVYNKIFAWNGRLYDIVSVDLANNKLTIKRDGILFEYGIYYDGVLQLIFNGEIYIFEKV